MKITKRFLTQHLLFFAITLFFLHGSTVFAAKNLIANGTASGGLSSWTQASGAWETITTEVTPVSGVYFAAGMCEKGELYQDVS